MPRRGAPRGAGDGSRLVYSSADGRHCANCHKPLGACVCPRRTTPERPAGDGTARVRREVKGRRGKTVTTIQGLALDADALRELAGELKRLCGSGGAVKDGVIEVQGDHVERLCAALRERGHRAVRAGG